MGECQREFFSLRPPENFEVRELAELLAKRISALLNVAASRRQAGDAEESDRLARDQPWLSEVYAASVCGRLATGPDSGPDRGDRGNPESIDGSAGPRCVAVAGFGLPGHERLRMQAR